MSQLQGTLIISPIVPPTTEDLFGTHYAKYGIGGYRTVQDLIERNSISVERRELMMLVGVISESKIYQLSESLDNSGWIEYRSIYDSSGSGYSLVDNPNYKIKSIQSGSNIYIIDSNGELSINSVSHSIEETGSGISLLVNNKIKTIVPGDGIYIQDTGNELIITSSVSSASSSINSIGDGISLLSGSNSILSIEAGDNITISIVDGGTKLRISSNGGGPSSSSIDSVGGILYLYNNYI